MKKDYVHKLTSRGESNKKGGNSWWKWLVIIAAVGLAGKLAWEYKVRTWPGYGRFTVIKLNRQITVESVDPLAGSGVRLTLPENLVISTVGGHGQWRVAALNELGKQFGRKWEADSIADYLGAGYTAWESQLSWWDRLAWMWWSTSSEWRDISVGETTLVEAANTPDPNDLQVLGLRWSSKAAEWFASQEIQAEGLTVTIVNTVGETGMGTHAARWVDSTGMRVGMITDSGENLDKCQVAFHPADKDRAGVAALVKMFGCDKVMQEGVEKQISLKLGKQYRYWLRGE